VTTSGNNYRLKLSKFVSQPFELPIVTFAQGALQTGRSVVDWRAASETVRVGWPAHATVSVDAPEPPL